MTQKEVGKMKKEIIITRKEYSPKSQINIQIKMKKMINKFLISLKECSMMKSMEMQSQRSSIQKIVKSKRSKKMNNLKLTPRKQSN